MHRLTAASLAVTTALTGALVPAPAAWTASAAQAATPAGGWPRDVDALTDSQKDEVWSEMERQVYDSGWEVLEQATEQAWGEALDRDKTEAVMKIVEAAADQDWRTVGEETTAQLLDLLPRGLGFYVEAMQFAHGEMRETIDAWAAELYDHPSYARLETMVAQAYRDTRRQTTSQIGVEDEPFLPSYRIGRVAAGVDPAAREREVARMRAVEAALFDAWVRGDEAVEQEQFDLAFGGGFSSMRDGSLADMFDDAYPARLRQVLGYEPTPRQVFNHFYYRITRPNMAEYAENYERVRTRQAQMHAIMARNEAIDAWLRLQPEPVRACPPSSLRAGHVGAGADQTAVIASVRQMTDMATTALRAEGIDPSGVPLLSAAIQGSDGFLTDRVNVAASTLPGFSGGRFDGTIMLVLPQDTTTAFFRGRPDSFAGSLRTAEVPVGQAIGRTSLAYMQARFNEVHLSRDGRQAAGQPLSIELIGPQYSYRYGAGLIRPRIVSELSLGVSVCLNGERVIDRVYESGPTAQSLDGLGFSGRDHEESHGDTLNTAIISVLEQALADMALSPGFETALRAGGEQEEDAAAVRTAGRGERLTPQEAFDQLRQLNEWRDQGRITEAQYNDLRDQILSSARD